MSENALILTQRLPPDAGAAVNFDLKLTARERTRSRHRFANDSGQWVYLRLPRGTVLQPGDRLQNEDETVEARIVAKPEPVLTVTATDALDLLRAAYHLGNRHVSVELQPNYLRLSPDPVLERMLRGLNLEVRAETVPFFPEIGAYGHQH